MKTMLLASTLMGVIGGALAEDTLGSSTWDYAYVDLHQKCERYYSLYPPSVKCIEDNLFGVRFKITYSYRGSTRTVFLTYIPGPQTRLDDNGNIIPPDYTVKGSS